MQYIISALCYFILIVVLLSFTNCSNSAVHSTDDIVIEEPPEPETTGTYGGSGDDIGKSILEIADGGLFVSGTTTSSDGDFLGLNRGNRDVFAIKQTISGSLSFIHTYGGTNSDWAMDSTEDAGGNLYITGYSRSNDQHFLEQNKGENDLFLMKIAPEGSLLWARTYGGSDEDYGYSLQIIDDHIYIAGATRSSDGDISDKTGTDKDILILKTDPDGEFQWIKTFGSSGNDEALSITYGGSENIAITGTFETGDSLFGDAQPGVLGTYIMELDFDGNILGKQTFSGSGTDTGLAVRATADPGYIIGGHSDSSNRSFENFSAGEKNGFLMKINQKFEPVWTLSLGGSESDEVHSVYPLDENVWMAAGETRSPDFLSESPEYEGLNAFVILFDSDGNIRQSQIFGGSRSDVALDATILKSGKIAISGWTLSNDGPFGGPLKAGRDTYLLKFSPENLDVPLND